MEATEMVRPVIALGLWTMVMALWMVVTRMPAMSKAKIAPQQAQDTSRLRDLLPPQVQRVANNYNHLFEQPTLFYATALGIAVAGHVDPVHLRCAWGFVVLRVAHSLVQATVDVVMARFALFMLSWLALAIMLVREAVKLV